MSSIVVKLRELLASLRARGGGGGEEGVVTLPCRFPARPPCTMLTIYPTHLLNVSTSPLTAIPRSPKLLYRCWAKKGSAAADSTASANSGLTPGT